MVASLRRMGGFLLPALVVVAATWPIAPAFGADPAPPPARGGPDRPHPDAAKINQANSRVIHAGPGTPLTGAIHVPPAQAKKEKKSD
jgi:hypothetical protein